MIFERIRGNSLPDLVLKLNNYTKHYYKKSASIEIDDLIHKETCWQTTVAREPLGKRELK